jgi:hypothetical protein
MGFLHGLFKFATLPARFVYDTGKTMYEGGKEMVHAHDVGEFSEGVGKLFGAPIEMGADLAVEAATGVPNATSAFVDATGLSPLDYYNNYKKGIKFIGKVMRGEDVDLTGAAERAAADIAAGYVGGKVGGKVGGGEVGRIVGGTAGEGAAHEVIHHTREYARALREVEGRYAGHEASDEDLGHTFLHYTVGPGSTTSEAGYDVTDAPQGAQYNVAAG